MRSKKSIKKHPLVPDQRYRSLLVARVINKVMLHGKKTVAEDIVYSAMAKLVDPSGESDEKQVRRQALEIFEKAVRVLMPEQEVRSRRVGGATYQVPMPVRHSRSQTLAVRWLVDAARSRSGKPMADLLAEELKNAYNKTGVAYKKKEDTHRMAQANRAFAHFGWFNRR